MRENFPWQLILAIFFNSTCTEINTHRKGRVMSMLDLPSAYLQSPSHEQGTYTYKRYMYIGFFTVIQEGFFYNHGNRAYKHNFYMHKLRTYHPPVTGRSGTGQMLFFLLLLYMHWCSGMHRWLLLLPVLFCHCKQGLKSFVWFKNSQVVFQ